MTQVILSLFVCLLVFSSVRKKHLKEILLTCVDRWRPNVELLLTVVFHFFWLSLMTVS